MTYCYIQLLLIYLLSLDQQQRPPGRHRYVSRVLARSVTPTLPAGRPAAGRASGSPAGEEENRRLLKDQVNMVKLPDIVYVCFPQQTSGME